MQAQIRDSDRLVIQTGNGLGQRAGCTIVELTDGAYANLLSALTQPNGGVRLAVDGSLTVLDSPEPPEPPPSDADGLMEALATIDVSGSTGLEEMSFILMGFGALAKQKGGW